MIEFVRIEVGEGAPVRCAHCAPPVVAECRTTESILAEISAASAAWGDSPGPNVLLAGSEPFAHPELPALVAACVEEGVERIGLETEGGALAAHGNAAGVLGAGVRHLQVVVIAADDAIADGLTGRPGRMRAVKAGVAAYLDAARDAGVAVVVTAVVPLCRHTLPDLAQTVGLLASWSIHAVRLVPGDDPLHDSASVMIAAACDTGMVNHTWVEVADGVPLPVTHRLHALTIGSAHV
ncbi:MAG: radical SAM protein [Coriobacteriia bacterium]|nr:radical SAM protein [Coriobacteriia bacterium]